jgi:lipoprotein-anchoring transpeptidase ErfK/SrfK
MPDYYPLIARAVGSLNPNTPEQRRVLYDRARKTLVDQLRINDPTLAQTNVKAESAALEAAIQRVERDFVRPAAPPPPRPKPRPRPGPAYAETDEPSAYRDLPPLADTGKRWRLLVGAGVAALLIIGGVVAYSYLPRSLSAVRSDMHTMASAQRSAPAATVETPEDKSNYVRMRQLVYYRTNQPVGTLVVDKNQTFLYVVRPNVSALRYNIGVGPECTTLTGLYHVVRKEEPKPSGDPLGARVLYLDKDYRIHGSSAAIPPGKLAGCIRLVDDDVIYLYDRTPLESRVVVAN